MVYVLNKIVCHNGCIVRYGVRGVDPVAQVIATFGSVLTIMMEFQL